MRILVDAMGGDNAPAAAALGAAAKKTLAGLIPELAALIEAAEDALR